VRPDHCLGAEGTADVAGQHPDPGWRYAEQRGDGQLDGLDALAGVIQRQLVTIPGRRGGQRLQRVVVVGGEPERRVDPQVRSREPRFGVPAAYLRGHEAAEQPVRLVGVNAALADRRNGRSLRVTDVHQRGSVLSLPQAVGHDDRDRLAGVVNHVILHWEERLARAPGRHQGRDQRHRVHLRRVEVSEDTGHALGALRDRGIDRGDPAAGYPGADDLGVGQPRQRDLARVPCGACRTIARCASSTLNAFRGLSPADPHT
jgi:hypothetical protein